MKQLNVYLNFPGTCRDALNFYREALGGEITSLQTFGESPVEVTDDNRDRVMHAEFRAGDIYFMASDSLPEHGDVRPGSAITLSVNLSDEAEQTAIFERLSNGGQVTMPLEDTFWGARFGMLVDRFGIPWMLNCEKTVQQPV
jgi:PhnB protein